MQSNVERCLCFSLSLYFFDLLLLLLLFVFTLINSRIFALKQRLVIHAYEICNNSATAATVAAFVVAHSLAHTESVIAKTPLFTFDRVWISTLTLTHTLSLTRRRCIIAWRVDCSCCRCCCSFLFLFLFFALCRVFNMHSIVANAKLYTAPKLRPQSPLNWHNDLIKNKHLHCIATMRRRLRCRCLSRCPLLSYSCSLFQSLPPPTSLVFCRRQLCVGVSFFFFFHFEAAFFVDHWN